VPTTLTVTSNLGFGPGTLRAAVEQANFDGGGDTINFASSPTADTIQLETGATASDILRELQITKDVTIQGPGASLLAIDANNGSRAFEIMPGAHVTISGLKIEDGNGVAGLTDAFGDPAPNDNYGGDILNDGTLTVSGCLLSGDSVNANAYYYGGGIYNAGTMTVSGCTVTHSIAGHFGGGIYNAGTMTLSGSNVSANFAYDSGGGIYNTGTLAVSGSTVTDNVAQYDGGGIYNFGTATVTGSSLTDNQADRDGGGIYNDSTMTLSGSTLSGNVAFIGRGGGIFNDRKGRLTIQSKSTITNNSPDDLDNLGQVKISKDSSVGVTVR
jgi:hypothetical protein